MDRTVQVFVDMLCGAVAARCSSARSAELERVGKRPGRLHLGDPPCVRPAVIGNGSDPEIEASTLAFSSGRRNAHPAAAIASRYDLVA
jgi:hypothetical protein